MGKSIWMDHVMQWLRSIWLGKLDAVFLGWLIGVFIAIINWVVSTYGGEIRSTAVGLINGVQEKLDKIL